MSEKIGSSVFASMTSVVFESHLRSHGLEPTIEELQPISATLEIKIDEPCFLPRQMDGDPIGESCAK